MALKADGTVVAWGDNYFGETNVPAGLSNVVSIAAMEIFMHWLCMQGGTVVGWGDNNYGQTNVPGDLTNATAIAAGDSFSMALRDDGTVVVWAISMGKPMCLVFGTGNADCRREITLFRLNQRHRHRLGLQWWWFWLEHYQRARWFKQRDGHCRRRLPYAGAESGRDGGGVGRGNTTTNEDFGNYGQSMVPEGLSNVVAIAGGGFYSMALRADGTVVVMGR